MTKKDYTRLILSDLHIGSPNSKEDLIYGLINTVDFDELILAGDVIDFIRVPKFTERTLKIFNLLNECIPDKKIVYIVGNHDIAFQDFCGKKVMGINFKSSYDFEYADRKYRVEHGDRFEKGLVKNRLMMNFISICQDIIERVFGYDLATWYAHRQIKKRKLRRIWDIIKWNKDVDVFIMGHTHNPEVLIWVDSNESIKTYINCGDWVEHSTYVIIKDNQVRLKNFK